MKNLTRRLPLIACFAMIFLVDSCTKDDDAVAPQTGRALFWTASQTLGGSFINISVDGKSVGSITLYAKSVPACDDAGFVTITKPSGTYDWTGTGQDNTKWSGKVTITANQCFKVELTPAAGTGGGSGTGGGAGTGGSSTGQVMFWIKSDLGCGNISVVIGNQTNLISTYYSSGAPSCAASGCATFTLNPGTYSYTASCSGKTWSGSVSVTSAGCSRTELTSTTGGGGAAGGGGGGGTASCASTNSFVTANGVLKNICGNTNDVEVTVKNNSNQRLAIRIAIERTSGAWDCGIVNLNSGGTGTYWICKGTGKFSIKSMLDSDWLTNCTFGACPG